MWKQPCSVQLCTWAGLHGEAQTFKGSNKGKNNNLTREGLYRRHPLTGTFAAPLPKIMPVLYISASYSIREATESHKPSKPLRVCARSNIRWVTLSTEPFFSLLVNNHTCAIKTTGRHCCVHPDWAGQASVWLDAAWKPSPCSWTLSSAFF